VSNTAGIETQTTTEEQTAAPEENPTTESQDGQSGEGDGEQSLEALPSWAREELTRVRNEAAARRVELKTVREELAKAKSPEEYQAAIDGYEKRIAELEFTATRDAVAREFNLPPVLADLLKGEDADALKAHAKELAAFAPKEESTSPAPNLNDLSGGLRPNQGGGDDIDPAEVVKRIRRRR
jgi:hypothetical protein